VTGQTVSPPLFECPNQRFGYESMEIVGKEKVIKRVREAIEILEKMK
jgi:hypothetical protein